MCCAGDRLSLKQRRWLGAGASTAGGGGDPTLALAARPARGRRCGSEHRGGLSPREASASLFIEGAFLDDSRQAGALALAQLSSALESSGGVTHRRSSCVTPGGSEVGRGVAGEAKRRFFQKRCKTGAVGRYLRGDPFHFIKSLKFVFA